MFGRMVIHSAKVKVLPVTGHEGPEGEQMYSSTLPSTSEQMRVGDQCHAPGALPSGKTRYLLYRRLAAENLAPTGIRSPDRPARSELLYTQHYSGPREIQKM